MIEPVLGGIEEVRAVDLDIRFDAAAAINGATEVGLLLVGAFQILVGL